MSTRLFVMLATTTGAFVALGAIARRTPIVSSGDDAGVNQTQPPASFRDAGLRVVDDQPALVDAGAPDGGTAQQPDPGPSEAEMQTLRDQIAAVEHELATSRADPQAGQLQVLNDQVAAAREQLAEEQGQREAESAAEQQALAQTQSAVDALVMAGQRLAAGDSDVLDPLDQTLPALPYPAQRAVESARESIQSEDLAAARYWISVAIAETDRSQLRR